MINKNHNWFSTIIRISMILCIIALSIEYYILKFPPEILEDEGGACQNCSHKVNGTTAIRPGFNEFRFMAQTQINDLDELIEDFGYPFAAYIWDGNNHYNLMLCDNSWLYKNGSNILFDRINDNYYTVKDYENSDAITLPANSSFASVYSAILARVLRNKPTQFNLEVEKPSMRWIYSRLANDSALTWFEYIIELDFDLNIIEIKKDVKKIARIECWTNG